MTDFSGRYQPPNVAGHSRLGPARHALGYGVGSYRAFCAAVCVVMFFTGLSIYAYSSGLVPFPPLFVVYGLSVLALPLIASQSGAQALLSSRLTRWALANAVLVAFSYLWSSQSAVATRAVRTQLLCSAFLAILIVLFSDREVVRRSRFLVLWCTIFAIALNCYELFHPKTFSAEFGRAAGLYINPNISASAIVAGMILSVQLVKGSQRTLLVMLAGLGIFLTLSRGALLCWAVVVTSLVIQGHVRPRQVLTGAVLLALVSTPALIAAGQYERIVAAYDLIESHSQGFRRVVDVQDVIASGDYSTEERTAVAARAFELFKERPLTGFGIGTTNEWEFRASTHNMYLRYGAEYGIFGIALYFWLVVLLLHDGARGDRVLAVNMCLFILVWGLFSHNVLEEWHLLLAIALCHAALREVPRDRATAQIALAPI